MPAYSPWGAIQSAQKVRPGVTIVTTARHGGIRVAPGAASRLPEPIRNLGIRSPDGTLWWEEDQVAALAAFAWPDEVAKIWDIKVCRSVIQDSMPEVYEALTGEKLTEEDSFALRERAAQERHKDDMVVRTAWGDWQTGVPKGMVGVYATRGGRNGPEGADEAYFLVDAARYDSKRTLVGYVIDPALDTPWEDHPGASTKQVMAIMSNP
jgi:hypothetical protein